LHNGRSSRPSIYSRLLMRTQSLLTRATQFKLWSKLIFTTGRVKRPLVLLKALDVHSVISESTKASAQTVRSMDLADSYGITAIHSSDSSHKDRSQEKARIITLTRARLSSERGQRAC
jgi:hypothetical protein